VRKDIVADGESGDAGIIQHHSEDETMVPFVKKLVQMHISKKNTLIVVVIPMTGEYASEFILRRTADLTSCV